MKKRAKTKTSAQSQRLRAASAGRTELPDLVTVMTKFVERIESLEKKTDLLTGRVSSFPSEIRHLLGNIPRPAHQPYHPNPGSQPEHGSREKILYEAVCADCVKHCKVPFRPSENRPVYCPECFAIRKAGHVPQDPTERAKMPHPPKQITPASHGGGRLLQSGGAGKPATSGTRAPSKRKKQKPAKKSKKKDRA